MPSSKRKFAVYRNLNNGQLSIKSLDTNLVVGHCLNIVLSDAVFKVSQKGIERIRKKQRKEVVATVVGNITQIDGFVSYKGRSHGPFLVLSPGQLPDQVFFDPYKWDGFVDTNGDILDKRKFIEISKSGTMRSSDN